MRSHVRWNVPRVALVLARPKRFETDSGSMPPTSSFAKGCQGPGTPHVNLDETFTSYRLLAGRERTQRMSPRGGSLTTPPCSPRCGAPACSPAIHAETVPSKSEFCCTGFSQYGRFGFFFMSW